MHATYFSIYSIQRTVCNAHYTTYYTKYNACNIMLYSTVYVAQFTIYFIVNALHKHVLLD